MINPFSSKWAPLRTGSLILLLVACRGQAALVETGLLIRFHNAAEAPVPGEIRLEVYDQGGPLFANERLPRSGPLIPTALPELGTLLLYPGETAGPLRLHARGYREAERVSEGVIRMVQPRAGQLLEATVLLASAPLADGDGDGVPDEIDNCAAANPDQRGCVGVEPADAGSGADGILPDLPGADRPDPLEGGAVDAGDTDLGPSTIPNGRACSAAAECTSGFCTDGVCCDRRCDGQCQACNRIPGTCTAAAPGTDPEQECGLFTCNGQGACHGSCDATCGGQCAARAHCRSGQCVSDLASGSGCTADCQCTSGRCRATLLSESCE